MSQILPTMSVNSLDRATRVVGKWRGLARVETGTRWLILRATPPIPPRLTGEGDSAPVREGKA